MPTFQSSQMFSPFKIGAIELKHRIVLAPLTRMRAPHHMPNGLMKTYYEQRATDGGLLITEGTFPSERAVGYKTVPSIWDKQQTEEWKKIVHGVHKKGGIFFLQLWHVGRASMFKPVSSVAVPLSKKGAKVPHALTIPEIKETVEEFRLAALNAKEAGFDGIEIHSANGYLLQQFLDSTINSRTDAYGGNYENRVRFLLEVIEAVEPIFPNRVGVRLSPYTTFQDTNEMDEQFWIFVVQQLNKFPLAYLHLVEPRAIGGGQDVVVNYTLNSLVENNKLPLILAGGFNADNFKDKKDCAIAFGRYFISNPTLVEKLRNGETLTPYDRSTFYSAGEKGYTDYS